MFTQQSCQVGTMLVFRMLCRIHAQNWGSNSDGSRTDNGSEFQSVGPETAQHLWPYLIVLKRGTARSPRTAERRWPRLADSETGEHSSARYAGAAWCRLLYTRTHTLYSPRQTVCFLRLPFPSAHTPSQFLPQFYGQTDFSHIIVRYWQTQCENTKQWLTEFYRSDHNHNQNCSQNCILSYGRNQNWSNIPRARLINANSLFSSSPYRHVVKQTHTGGLATYPDGKW